jgi:hypothetical protein
MKKRALLVALLAVALPACGKRVVRTSTDPPDPPPPPVAPVSSRVVATSLDAVGLASDGTHLYWLDPDRNAVVRVPQGGGEVKTVAATTRPRSALAVDAERVYFAEDATPETGGPYVSHLMSAPKAGGSATPIATVPGATTCLATDQANLYFVDGASGLVTMPKGGGLPKTLAKDASLSTVTLVVDDAYLFWQGNSPRAVMRMAKAGGPIVPIAKVETYWASNLAADERSLFWWANHRVWQVDKAGGTPRAVAPVESPHGLAWITADRGAWYLMAAGDGGGAEIGPGTAHSAKLMAVSR